MFAKPSIRTPARNVREVRPLTSITNHHGSALQHLLRVTCLAPIHFISTTRSHILRVAVYATLRDEYLLAAVDCIDMFFMRKILFYYDHRS